MGRTGSEAKLVARLRNWIFKQLFMGVDLLPDFIRSHYEVHEYQHACARIYPFFDRGLNNLRLLLELRTAARPFTRISLLWNLPAPESVLVRRASGVLRWMHRIGWRFPAFLRTALVMTDNTRPRPTSGGAGA